MKYLLLFVIGLFTIYTGQAQTGLTSQPKQIQYLTSEKIIEKITYFGPRNGFYKVETFLPDSTLYGIAYFALYADSIDPRGLPGLGKAAAYRQGPSKIFYPTGQIYLENNYVEGVLDGPMTLFYGDGSIKRQALYYNGYLKHSQCFDKAGQEVPCQALLEAVHFTGKPRILKHYLVKAIRPIIKQTAITGMHITLSIDELGQIANIFIKLSPTDSAATIKEAIKKVIVDMPQWTPGRSNFAPSRMDDVTMPDIWRIDLDRYRGPLSAYLQTP